MTLSSTRCTAHLLSEGLGFRRPRFVNDQPEPLSTISRNTCNHQAEPSKRSGDAGVSSIITRCTTMSGGHVWLACPVGRAWWAARDSNPARRIKSPELYQDELTAPICVTAHNRSGKECSVPPHFRVEPQLTRQAANFSSDRLHRIARSFLLYPCLTGRRRKEWLRPA